MVTLFLESLNFYLLLCLISIVTGKGILWLLGFRTENEDLFYLNPLITLTFWTIFLGVGITAGYSVKQLWKVGWILTAILFFLGLKRPFSGFLRSETKVLSLILFITVAVMFPYFWYGLKEYLGSTAPDGWSYIVYGQYLWEYPRGMEGSLAPLYQYASHLNGTRFIASALLAFFSPIFWRPGDTQMASGLFLAWSLFVFSAACIYFAKAQRCSNFFLIIYLSLCGFSGWILNLLWANNFDNALAISFLPTLAGLIYSIDKPDLTWGLILSFLIAGILYIYPEMAIFVVGGAFLFYVHRLSGEMKKTKWLALLFLSCGLAAILLVPFSKELVTFLKSQISTSVGNPGVRPGEGYFPTLNQRIWFTSLLGVSENFHGPQFLTEFRWVVTFPISSLGDFRIIEEEGVGNYWNSSFAFCRVFDHDISFPLFLWGIQTYSLELVGNVFFGDRRDETVAGTLPIFQNSMGNRNIAPFVLDH